MYRKVNLRNMSNPGVLPEPSNFPDRLGNDKNLVFLHGYQPDAGESGDMSAWLAEMFKRHYQSGSRAKFHGVLWYSNQGDPMDYQRSVTNAFQTAPILKSYIQGLSGPVVIEAHSLGNMVVSSALADHRMSVEKYMMCNAAVASEAYDQTAPQTNSLVGEWWADYSNRTWAANWYQLFVGSGNSRERLTWRDRFADILVQTDVWNIYSSADEVFSLTPDPGLFAGALGLEADWWFILPVNVNLNVNFEDTRGRNRRSSRELVTRRSG
jgi:pimeloyl-ACP methyl ester carboxylesterase